MSKKIRAGARAAPTQARPEVSAAPASQPAKEGFGSDELSNGQGTALRVKAMQAVAAVDAPAPFEQFAGYPKTPEERGVSLARIARRFGEALRSAPSGVKAMLQDLKRLGVDDVDVFQGSHTLVDGDNGALYERWKTLGAHPRTAPSSHYRDVPVQQYELDIPGVGVALFGKTLAGQTWFQVEAHTGSESHERVTEL